MSRQDNLSKLITNYNRRLQKLKEQHALMGMSVDPKIPLEIEDIEAAIEKLEVELKAIEDEPATISQTVIPPYSEQQAVSPDQPDFLYDAYISYVDKEPDATWVWEELVPQLEQEGFRVAVSGYSGRLGVPQIVNIEQGIKEAKRIVLVLSPNYLSNDEVGFENLVAQTEGIRNGIYPLLPIKIYPFDPDQLREGLRILTALDLTNPRQARNWFEKVAKELQRPLSSRGRVDQK